jgi:NADH:ubiquinone reductase (H+-translocating)
MLMPARGNQVAYEVAAPPDRSGLHRVVIVGGGAGGLELATRLGDKLGRRGRAHITLIDQARSHVWKPKLHEIAAGSMDVGVHEVSYRAQAHGHGFSFRIGGLCGIDRARREVHVAPWVDEDGVEVTPARSFGYDTLVIAIGSLVHSFGTPGVDEHGVKLETTADARRFQRRLVNALVRAHAQQAPRAQHQLSVAIVGAGATGVELAAELHRSTRELVAYGLDRIDPEQDLRLHLVEAADRVLPGLPPPVSATAARMLVELGVRVHTGVRVAEVTADGLRLADGGRIAAELVVWAAGVKAHEVLATLDGLEVNRINQLVVRPTLQTTRDDDVFAIGDCAACPWPHAGAQADASAAPRWVPPRAQAAHQQASLMLRQVQRRLARKALAEYRYRDFGSLVSLGAFSTVGNLMGGERGRSLLVEGLFARLMYESLYKMHELALHGMPKVALDTLARWITRRNEPHVKLH